MIGTHAWTYVGDFVSVGVLVGAFVALMVAAERRDRADARRRARRAASPYPPASNVRRIPR